MTFTATAIFSYLIVAVAAATLIYAAAFDLKHFIIRNSLVLSLISLYLLHAAITWRWTEVPADLGLAAVIFAIGLAFYALGLLGGGDVKLLAVAFLWVGMRGALLLAGLLVLFSLVYVIAALFGWIKTRKTGGRRQIAFAPVVASALAGAFLLGAVQPWPW
jgi:prepilin peptidase CpaA